MFLYDKKNRLIFFKNTFYNIFKTTNTQVFIVSKPSPRLSVSRASALKMHQDVLQLMSRYIFNAEVRETLAQNICWRKKYMDKKYKELV